MLLLRKLLMIYDTIHIIFFKSFIHFVLKIDNNKYDDNNNKNTIGLIPQHFTKNRTCIAMKFIVS